MRIILLLALSLFLHQPQATNRVEEMVQHSVHLFAFTDRDGFSFGIETSLRADQAIVSVEYWEKTDTGVRLVPKEYHLDLTHIEPGNIVQTDRVPTRADRVKDVTVTLVANKKKKPVAQETFVYNASSPVDWSD